VKKIYKYSFSRHTLSLTTIYLTIFLALGIGLYFLYEGGYLSAWFFSFIVALVALMSLSIPRRILVDDIEIRQRLSKQSKLGFTLMKLG
jgi:hypothetical protein